MTLLKGVGQLVYVQNDRKRSIYVHAKKGLTMIMISKMFKLQLEKKKNYVNYRKLAGTSFWYYNQR